jgi:hypothetical protein
MTLRSRTLSSVWSQEGCQRDGDLIRFTHQSSSGYYMARLLFDYKCRPEQTLVVLVYNPSKAPITLAAGSFGSGLRVVQPSSGAASAGDATEAYDVNKMPSPGEIIWGQHAGWVSTEVDQEIVGDELVFNVNMELCDSTEVATSDTERLRRESHELGGFKFASTTSASHPSKID